MIRRESIFQIRLCKNTPKKLGNQLAYLHISNDNKRC